VPCSHVPSEVTFAGRSGGDDASPDGDGKGAMQSFDGSGRGATVRFVTSPRRTGSTRTIGVSGAGSGHGGGGDGGGGGGGGGGGSGGATFHVARVVCGGSYTLAEVAVRRQVSLLDSDAADVRRLLGGLIDDDGLTDSQWHGHGASASAVSTQEVALPAAPVIRLSLRPRLPGEPVSTSVVVTSSSAAVQGGAESSEKDTGGADDAMVTRGGESTAVW
jgi:hypothetical protein